MGLTLESSWWKSTGLERRLGYGEYVSRVYLLVPRKAGLFDQGQTDRTTRVRRPRLLLVDDNLDATLTLGMLLEVKGFQCILGTVQRRFVSGGKLSARYYFVGYWDAQCGWL